MKNIVLAIVFIAFSPNMFAQGAVLAKGESGFGISGGYTANFFAKGYSGSIGYTFKGVVDLGLMAGKVSQKESDSDRPNLRYEAKGSFASVYLLKQNRKLPFSLSLDGAYQNHSYSYDEMSDYSTMKGSAITYGVSLYSKLGEEDVLKMQPVFGFHHTTNEYEEKYKQRIYSRRRSGVDMFSFGIQIIFKPASEKFFVATPVIGFTDGNPTFSVTANMIFF